MSEQEHPALKALNEEMYRACMADPLADRWLPDMYVRTEAEIRKLIAMVPTKAEQNALELGAVYLRAELEPDQSDIIYSYLRRVRGES